MFKLFIVHAVASFEGLCWNSPNAFIRPFFVCDVQTMQLFVMTLIVCILSKLF